MTVWGRDFYALQQNDPENAGVRVEQLGRLGAVPRHPHRANLSGPAVPARPVGSGRQGSSTRVRPRGRLRDERANGA